MWRDGEGFLPLLALPTPPQCRRLLRLVSAPCQVVKQLYGGVREGEGEGEGEERRGEERRKEGERERGREGGRRGREDYCCGLRRDESFGAKHFLNIFWVSALKFGPNSLP